MQEALALRYKGARLKSGMDAKEVASSIEGFADFSKIAARAIYGDEPNIIFKVREVKPGSLNIEFWMEVVGLTQSLSAASPSFSPVGDLLEFIKTCILILKHLKGKPPTTVQKVSNGNAVQIENATGQTTIVNGAIYNIFIENDLGRSAERFARPLRNDASELEIRVGRKIAGTATKDEVECFQSVRSAEQTLENVAEVYLKVRAPVLEGRGVWKFGLGRSTISAPVTDSKFLAKVQSGREAFRAGDLLRVKLRSIQQREGTDVRTQHFVDEVISHQRPDRKQTDLL